MASDIILYEGNNSFKEKPDYGGFIAVPKAFLTEDFAGVRVEEKNKSLVINSENTGKRNLLTAIRGALLAQELPYINEDDPFLCFCACSNEDRYLNQVDYKEVQKSIGQTRFSDIKNFVPANFENIMETLLNNSFPFDGDEISEEIKSGRIKKSSTIDDLLHKNRELNINVDDYEYGLDKNLEELKSLLNTDFYEFAHIFRPFTDEYFANFDKNQFRAVQYGSINNAGLYAFSKLNNNSHMNFNLSLSFTNEFEGHINDLSIIPWIYAFILFKKSDKKINTMTYTKKVLENLHGKQERFTLEQKLPFLCTDHEAMIVPFENEIIVQVPDNYEFVETVKSIANNIHKRREFVIHYHLPSDN